MCRAGCSALKFKSHTPLFKRIMSLHREVASPPVPPAGATERDIGPSNLEVSVERSLNRNDRVIAMETFDKQKMAKILRAFLLAKYLRNDSVPCELEKGLYLGSIGAAFNKGLLQNLNITHILAVAGGVDMPFPECFKYLRIEVLDSADVDLAQHFTECFSFIDEARMSGGGVLVHCFAGRSRSVTIATAYMMRTYGIRLSQALAHITSRRKEAQPNPGFLKQLQNFDQELESEKRKRNERVERCSRGNLLKSLYKAG
ncbi:hypothetical protein AXG93_167s1140 [Marchantia polymorpha subsp. ruderalis]|uniref:Uncharacterized protein n=3 Tax=Marchantia polymorpha TaxID=3197 RepID=A0A176WPY0_MARPO|nr:hypothetical protein AXG93_167s1140 [Marchantia polymorpha subsp. ruderalis]